MFLNGGLKVLLGIGQLVLQFFDSLQFVRTWGDTLWLPVLSGAGYTIS